MIKQRIFPANQNYADIWQQMKQFTAQRNSETSDELWHLQHSPIYTLGQAGKHEHILRNCNIPIIHTDRGGQVTYHGPGQLIVYCLLDLQRRKWGIRKLVSTLEQAIISYLATLDIQAHTQTGAPGIYVNKSKIASIGLRVSRGCSYHGIALNVDMDLQPFDNINPCGYTGLKMTQISDLAPISSIDSVQKDLHRNLVRFLMQ